MNLLHELRSAARGIRVQPTHSALVVGVLAAGFACTIFMLVIVHGFIVRPLPFAHPDALLHAGLADNHGGDSLDDVAGRDLRGLREHLAGVADVAGYQPATINLSDLGRPERFDGAIVTANLWNVLGVSPQLGRDFTREDERADAAAVVILSWSLWQQRYGGDPAIVGRSVRVNAQPATVVGVMPPDFSYPFRQRVWTVAHLAESRAVADDPEFTLVLRRHDAVGAAAVATGLAAWLADATHKEPDRFRGRQVRTEPLAYLTVSRTTRAVLGIMLGAVVLVLLVACANAANLLLARTLGRGHELAVRAALGASRRRLIVHLMLQSALLCLGAAALGFVLAEIGVGWQRAVFRSTATDGPPQWLSFDVDATVVVEMIGVALLEALVTGWLPASRVGGEASASALRAGARSVSAGPFARISRALVVGEIVLSCALLIGVGTLVHGIAALDHVDPGIRTDHLLTARLGLFADRYPTAESQVQLYERLTERLRADADVVDASVTTALPLRFGENLDVLPDGVAFDGEPLPQVRSGAVDDHFLAAFGVRLLRGRFFDARDRAGGEPVAVVDENFAARYADGGDVVGRRFRIDPRAAGALVTVVGVVAPIRLDSIGSPPQPSLLLSLRQRPARFVSLAVRTRGDPAEFGNALVATMHEIDADTPLYWVRDYVDLVRDVTFGERVVARLFGVFGLVALALTAAGLYGVVAYHVGQRTREIGVRRALGAPGASVLRELFRRTGWQLAFGLVLGLGLGIPLTRLLTHALPSIAATSPGVIAGTLLVLGVAAMLAMLVPARRALRVAPLDALRYE